MNHTKELAQLRLFQLINPSLPIGSFTYSQGMEWAVENGWVKDAQTLFAWLESVLLDSLLWLELPILSRLYDTSKKQQSELFFTWSQQLLASRETKELRQEEINRGRAVLMVLNKLPVSPAWPELLSWRPALLKTQAASFALASVKWGISQKDLLMGYAWSWLDNAITVAIKLIPLGQSDGQAALYQLSELLPELVEQVGDINDDGIGASTPALAIASSLHETQYTRLFRS